MRPPAKQHSDLTRTKHEQMLTFFCHLIAPQVDLSDCPDQRRHGPPHNIAVLDLLQHGAVGHLLAAGGLRVRVGLDGGVRAKLGGVFLSGVEVGQIFFVLRRLQKA